MELKLKDINVCEYNKIINTNCSAEADIIVPDTKPDIHCILCVNSICNLDEYYVRKDKIIFSGNVNFNIMYVGENDKSAIYTIDYSMPFNHQCDVSDATEDCVCLATCAVASTDFKVKNSRKLLAKSNLAIKGQVMKHSVVKALEDIEDEDIVPFRQKTIKSDSMVNSKEFKFNISDTISFPSGEDFGEIYDFSVGVNIEEIKTVNNKAIIKGILPTKILYMGAGAPCVYETECSFTEIADLDMANSESVLSSHFCVSDISYEVSENDGEITVELDVVIKSCIKAYETMEYSLISDIYSPDYQYNISKSKSNLERYTCITPYQFTVKDVIGSNAGDNGISKVHYMTVYTSCNKTEYENSNVVVCGNVQTVVIYSNQEGKICSIQKNIPYKAEVPAADNLSNSFFDADVTPVNYGYVLSSDKDVQVRIVLKLSVNVYTRCDTSIITDFILDKNSPIDKSSQPGVVVCYPSGDMSLWDYAVKYNTTCQDIASVNNMDINDPIPKGSPILIPKRQIG